MKLLEEAYTRKKMAKNAGQVGDLGVGAFIGPCVPNQSKGRSSRNS